MRKLAVIGTLALSVLWAAMPVEAATTLYNVSGAMAITTNNCFNIAVSLTGNDCSYAKTRFPPKPVWQGPIGATGFYPKGSAADITDPALVLNGFLAGPGDGRTNVPLSGTVTIDDNGTPIGSDDTISATWNFGAAAFNAATGNGDRAVERWDSWNHVMDATPVSAATPVGIGFKYVIGARGEPQPLCSATDATDCFPSENVAGGTGAPGFWDLTVANTNPANLRIGIERSRGWGAFGPGNPLTPNIGGTTTAVMTNWSCTDNPGDTDCTGSASLLGPVGGTGPNGAPHGAVAPDGPLGPGFGNVVLILTTDGAGTITSALAYWTREYQILSGPEIADDAPGTFITNNSWGGGRFNFTGAVSATDPTAVDDTIVAPIVQGAASAVDVTSNDTQGDGTNTVSIEVAPAHGTAVASGLTVTYTPDATYSGPDTFDYRLTDGSSQFSVATVTLTVSDKVPVAGTFTASSRNGAATAAIPVLVPPTVLGTGTAAQHTVTAGAGVGGSCVASGGNVTYTPDAGFNGAGSCAFTIADFVDGDTSVGTLNVSVSGNTGGGGGGAAGPPLPGGSSLDLLTLGALFAGIPVVARRRRR